MMNNKYWFSIVVVLVVTFVIWYFQGGFSPPLTCKYQVDSTKLICADMNVESVINSPIHLTGEARGFWFFEGSFPVELLDSNDDVLASSIAVTNSEWMTEELVPYTIDFMFETPLGDVGTLILYKDNPSGESENDDSLKIPVKF